MKLTLPCATRGWRAAAAAMLAGLAASSCGVLDGGVAFEPPAVAVPAEPVEPIDAKRFVLTAGQDVVGELQVVNARHEDTFVDIARTYGLGYDELVQANPDVDPWLPGEGTPIVLPTRFVLPNAPREGIVLNVAAKRLFYFPPPAADGSRIVETFPIGIGREGWATPTGETAVVAKARDPVWFVPASIRREHAEAGDPLPAQVPPGPDNPLGNRVLGLGIPGYLIHGTNKPAGVGMRVSHGCVRLFPEDIEYLFEQVGIGVPVRIVNQPLLLGWDAGDLLLEAHPPLDEDPRDWDAAIDGLVRASLVEGPQPPPDVAAGRAAEIAAAARGMPVSVLAGRPDTAGAIRQSRRVLNTVSHDWLAERGAD